MVLLAALAAVTTPAPEAVRATVRIVQAQRIDAREWLMSERKREVVVREGDRLVTLRLIELE